MSFQQSLSGLYGASAALDVIGNNISNSSTVGFKGGNAQFADVFSASLSRAGSAAVGLGTKEQAIKQQFTQGSITATSNPFDIAINGNGMFQFTDSLSGGALTYSRNGQVQIKVLPAATPAAQHRYLANAKGDYLTGWAAGVTPSSAQAAAPIELVSSVSAKATTTSNLVVNLKADAPVIPVTIPPTIFDPNNPQSYNFTTPQTVYDSEGKAHSLITYFSRTPTPGVWDINTRLVTTMPSGTTVLGLPPTSLQLPDGSVTAVAATSVVSVQSGIVTVTEQPSEELGGPRQLNFTNNILSSGSPLSSTFAIYQTTSTSTAVMSPISIDFTNPAAIAARATTAAAIAAAAAAKIAAATTPAAVAAATAEAAAQAATEAAFGKSTQFGGSFAVDSLDQDGYKMGSISSIGILADGTIEGRYTNGMTSSLGTVALATFRNVNGLQSLGDNMWAATTGSAMSSGLADVNQPGKTNHGLLQGGAVEDSNVDLNQELVNMIFQQRSYQSNAQAVKAQDSLLQTLISIKS